jgi:hypothetical protein
LKRENPDFVPPTSANPRAQAISSERITVSGIVPSDKRPREEGANAEDERKTKKERPEDDEEMEIDDDDEDSCTLYYCSVGLSKFG